MADATIRDVAQRAQVSVASVSRVLNGLGNVSEQTRGRVADAILALGYVPHAGARSLSLSRTNAIGVVLPDLHGEFFSEIMRGMDREASARGYLLLLSNMHAGTDQATGALRAMRGRVDGLIVMAPHLSEADLATALPPGIPTVLINTRGQSGAHPSIRLDNAAGVRMVIQHLAEMGRRRLIHVAGPVDNVDAQERAEACAEAANHSGMDLEVVQGNFGEQSGGAAISALLDAGQRFDSIFAANDMMALGALHALQQRGVTVPDEVAVTGFDDIPLARLLGLTTVRVRIADLGQRTIERLVARLEGDAETGDEFHTPELVIRSTTDKRSIADA
ncbi:LacI family DNA-binding transcriptional regulator [Sphingomonas sp.]|uniref:LacI family DNA-binding transcriptional regulator n=1 Tax=Sphingomonas sp. TaxID=28214 RepID=UPI0025D56588|nr:LacI family DNA-binding transcriptional regulator [Sphingomonas sp.]MBV9529030.1 LacI family DNA-binding transcriptional regulator [Sphingomonas sp.]